MGEEKRLRERIQKLKHYMLNGVTSLTQMNHIEEYTKKQKELALKLGADNMVGSEVPAVSADQYLKRYNGNSTDNISRYLKLRDQEEKRKGNKYRRNGVQNRNSNQITNTNSQKDDEMKHWSLKRYAGHNRLSEGERKLCNVLKVKPKDLDVIKREIGARIRRHGLLGRGSTPNQIWIDIGDVKNVKESMTTRIGLVDPVVMPQLD